MEQKQIRTGRFVMEMREEHRQALLAWKRLTGEGMAALLRRLLSRWLISSEGKRALKEVARVELVLSQERLLALADAATFSEAHRNKENSNGNDG